MPNIIGLKQLRENVSEYAAATAKGKSFLVVRQSKPLFMISPVVEEESWETVIDFTRVKKGGVRIQDIAAAVGHGRTTKSTRKAAVRA